MAFTICNTLRKWAYLVVGLEVPGPARQHVDVHVRDGLPRGRPVLDADGQRLPAVVLLQLGRDLVHAEVQVCHLNT